MTKKITKDGRGRLKISEGHRFGNLTIVQELDKLILPCGQTNRYFECVCDCGNTTNVRLVHLRNDRIKSCGCLQGEHHGESRSKLYRVWRAMNERCHRPTNERDVRNYQNRGITVCDEWRNSFIAFRDWATTHGYGKGLEIDRRDNDKGYYPENCRWVTRDINVNNRRNTMFYEYNGEKIPITQLLSLVSVKRQTFINRVKLGWSVEEAINLKPWTKRI